MFATLHTQDAPQSIDRIIDVFPAHQQQQVRVQLAASLQGICTQQLAAAPRTVRAGPSRAEVLVATPGGPQPHPGGEDLPDLLADAGRREVRHGHDGPDARAARAAGRVTLEMALERCTNEEDLRRLDPAAELGGLMPTTFAYKVRDQARQGRRGSLEADDASLVVGKLRQMGYTPIAIEQKTSSTLKADIQDPGPVGPGEAEGRRGLLAPVRDDAWKFLNASCG